MLLNSHNDNSACPRLEHALTNMAKACWYRCKAIYATCDRNHEFFIPEQFSLKLETAGLMRYDDAYDDEEEEEQKEEGEEGENREKEGEIRRRGEEEEEQDGGRIEVKYLLNIPGASNLTALLMTAIVIR